MIVRSVTFVDRPSWWSRFRTHPLFDGLMWAVRFWVVGLAVVGVAYLLAPVSEAARSVFAPGRHGRRPAPEWWPTELAGSTVNYARPAVR